MGDNIKEKKYYKTEIGRLPADWNVKKIKEVAEVNSKSLNNNNTPEDYKFFYYDLSAVNKGKVNHPCEKIRFGNAPSRAKRLFKKYDILMSTVRPNLQGFAYVDFDSKDCVCSTGFAVIEGKHELDSMYLYQNLYSYVITNQINKLIVGSNYPAINGKDVENLKIPYPSDKNERRKIASILNTWDRAIELKEKLIEQKKEQKKGLMQKLLSGEVRLPGYKHSWKVYTIEQLAEFFTDGDWIETPYITEDGVLLIQTGNIGIGEYIEKNNMKFISEKSFIELNCTEVKPGDILICRLADPIGRSCIVPNTGIKMITAVDVAILRVNNNIAVTEFINYKLNLPKTLQKMDSLGAGSTRKRISRKNLEKVKLTIPDLEEQKAIADILLQIDKNIGLLEKELDELKKQKKGLMQLLLTGKVRV